jgi:hypothetical protein
VGSAFGALAGISIANTTTSRTPTAASSGSATPAPAGPRLQGGGPPGGPYGLQGPGGLPGAGAPPGPGGPGGPASGTITAINGSTLTLRTENGTETVDTSSSTHYSKALQSISFSDLQVGDIVGVMSAPPSGSGSSGGSGSSTPPEPGTGTVTATMVTVLEPSFTGRVASISNGTYTLVGPGGQLLTVATTASTRYYNSSMAKSSASAIASGDHVVAEGSQSDLTHLTADLLAVIPAPANPPVPPQGGPKPPAAGSIASRRPSARAASSSAHSRSRSKHTR